MVIRMTMNANSNTNDFDIYRRSMTKKKKKWHPSRSESPLCAHWVAKDQGIFMRTAETDQTGLMPRL